MVAQYNPIRVKDARLQFVWDTHTATAMIVLTAFITLASIKGSLKGGAIQP